MTWGSNELVDLIAGGEYLFEEEEWLTDHFYEWLQDQDLQWAIKHDPEMAYTVWGYLPANPNDLLLAVDPETGEQKETSPEEDIPF